MLQQAHIRWQWQLVMPLLESAADTQGSRLVTAQHAALVLPVVYGQASLHELLNTH